MNRLAVSLLAICLWVICLTCEMNNFEAMAVLTGILAVASTLATIGEEL